MTPDDALVRWDEHSFTHALRAVDAARVAAEARRAPDGPLRGLLFSVKDLFSVAGVESCAGSLLLEGWVPAADPPLIAALRAAGAVPFGKGVCAEFGFGIDTENRLDGRVLHFADASVSPGGSSGGDAVAVGAGIVDFAVAGDYGGSVRWPAQATGVLGLRLGTAHRFARGTAVGRLGTLPPGDGTTTSLQASLETAGLMARSAGVLRAVLAALAGRAADAALSSQVAARPARRLVTTDGTEIAPVRPEVAAAMDAARAAASRSGYALIPAPAGLREALREAREVYAALRDATDDHAAVRKLAGRREELLCESTRAVLDAAERTVAEASPATVAWLRRRAVTAGAAVRAALRAAGADALLLPVAPCGPTGFAARIEVAGREVSGADLMAHCRAISLTGLPALSVPVGRAPAGAGVSVQLAGPDGGEDLLCAVAADLEQALERMGDSDCLTHR